MQRSDSRNKEIADDVHPLQETLDAIKAEYTDILGSQCLENTRAHFDNKDIRLFKLHEALKSSLEENIDFNASVDVVTPHGKKGMSYLNIAAAYCSAAVVTKLIELGAKPDTSTVYYATKYQQKYLQEVLSVLKEHGVDFNAGYNKKNKSVLFQSICKRREEAVEVLKTHNAKMGMWESCKVLKQDWDDRVARAIISFIPKL